ncbi:MAG: acetyl-CoA carboxylase, carboxyltransferase subunit beta [Candidatus Omnitrophica bacterium]|nr:acetyl-CoA carboxylase, carboxyltransferase subunit beta [Candidatus Omnitrophota bacterium]MDD5310529.1 acetyl-CoA carboxylase, carboxyltransferase subunit beta [Candidatus Omnitrophota bacterium]MDD5546045.1 acetyl-CoA carboxylase, carboxyltransferase subunit beta [Candidatus Omnitrophota bacterium]
MFGRSKYTIVKVAKKKDIPEGLWTKCEECGEIIYNKALEENMKVCPRCSYHFVLTAQERIVMLLDAGSFEERDAGLRSMDPLQFKGPRTYEEKLKQDAADTGLSEACISGRGMIEGKRVIFVVTDSRFIMGSMGSVVGEKIARATELATNLRLPLVIVSGSGGGARMYEGLFSLMQMAKTSAAIAKLHEAGVPYISILTNPTMAGVMASFASLGDIIMAEPKALIGFTGPRVIEQTIRQKLPPGFQRSEFLLEHGLLDMIIHRKNLKSGIAQVIDYLT